MRDARIAAIYEGTNGIQAIDLVQRKIGLSGGETVRAEIADMRTIIADVAARNADAFGKTAERMGEAVDALERATGWMQNALGSATDDALAGATPYLRLFGIARGGASLAAMALAADADASRISLARFFAENIAVTAGGLESMVTGGAMSLANVSDTLAVA